MLRTPVPCPLNAPGLGCLHRNELGLFSAVPRGRPPSFLANGGSDKHGLTAPGDARLPQGNVAPGFAPAMEARRDTHGDCPTPPLLSDWLLPQLRCVHF